MNGNPFISEQSRSITLTGMSAEDYLNYLIETAESEMHTIPIQATELKTLRTLLTSERAQRDMQYNTTKNGNPA